MVALAALVGRSIGELPPLTQKPLPAFPGLLPDDVKIDLISRRADITASRWRVEAAEKSLASARAEFYPDVSINALAGCLQPRCRQAARIRQPRAASQRAPFTCRSSMPAGSKRATVARRPPSNRAVSSYHDTVISAARDVATQATTPRADRGAAQPARAAGRRGAAHEGSTAAARVRQGIDRFAHRADGDRILDRSTRRACCSSMRRRSRRTSPCSARWAAATKVPQNSRIPRGSSTTTAP